jgi:hypothetical protein
MDSQAARQAQCSLRMVSAHGIRWNIRFCRRADVFHEIVYIVRRTHPNMVEIFFGLIACQVIRRGISPGRAQVTEAIRRFIDACNEHA